MATKIIDYQLDNAPPSLQGVEQYDYLRVHLFVGERAVGKLTLPTGHRPLPSGVLIEAVAHFCLPEILTGLDLAPEKLAELLLSGNGMTALLDPSIERNQPDFQITLSIVVPTRDRPADLERCLASLVRLQCRHPFEIVVSDNNPASGLSEPVARRFPVKYVAETRPGASYARNAGIAATAGEIIVFTDDDVIVTPTWLDKLVAPFSDPTVGCVSGLVLPVELETSSQELFENYGEGGLERGFSYRRLGRDFFDKWHGAVQTWQLGGTANCAIRANLFCDPAIGPFDESLGPGTPGGVGEDTYMFYRILKAGQVCVYEPAALVYHRHRRDMIALRRQLFSYSKGAVAQQLRIFFTDNDRRALVQISQILPRWQLKRLFNRVARWDTFPLHLILLEIWGNFMGVPGYIQSNRRVKRLGRITTAEFAHGRAAASFLSIQNLKSEI